MMLQFRKAATEWHERLHSSNRLVLMHTNKGAACKIKIIKAVLYTRKVCVPSDVFLVQSNALETSNTVYNLDKIKVKSLTLPQKLISR